MAPISPLLGVPILKRDRIYLTSHPFWGQWVRGGPVGLMCPLPPLPPFGLLPETPTLGPVQVCIQGLRGGPLVLLDGVSSTIVSMPVLAMLGPAPCPKLDLYSFIGNVQPSRAHASRHARGLTTAEEGPRPSEPLGPP